MDRDQTEAELRARQARTEARRAELEAAQRRLEHDQHLTDQRRITDPHLDPTRLTTPPPGH